MKTVRYDASLEKAAREYISRKEHLSHPVGTFDKLWRWEPDAEESCDCCCEFICKPERESYPCTLFQHCTTIEHIAHLYKVDKSDLRKKVQAMNKTA